MSVILDALKKAQNERRDVTKNLPYNPKAKLRKSHWLVYGTASAVFCLLILFLLIPGTKKSTTLPVMEGKPTQAPPLTEASPIVFAEKTPPVVQSAAPTAAVPLDQPQSQRPGPQKDLTPLKEKGKMDKTPLVSEPAGRNSLRTAPSQQVAQAEGPKVLITPVDHEKINSAYNEAVKETEKGNLAGAKRLYQSILAEQAGHIESLNNLGVIAMKEGNTKEALFFFNKVLQHKKDHSKAYNNIGLVVMKDGQERLAEEYFRKSVELGRGDIEPSLNLAALLRAGKRYEEASSLLEGYLTGNMKNRSLYLSYALIKDDMAQYDEAIKYYRLYLREGGSGGERGDVAERLKMLEAMQHSKNR